MEFISHKYDHTNIGVYHKGVKLWEIDYMPVKDMYYIHTGTGFINLQYYGTGIDIDFTDGKKTHKTLDDAKRASEDILKEYMNFF